MFKSLKYKFQKDAVCSFSVLWFPTTTCLSHLPILSICLNSKTAFPHLGNINLNTEKNLNTTCAKILLSNKL